MKDVTQGNPKFYQRTDASVKSKSALIRDINKWKLVIGTSLASIGLLYLSILNEGLLFWNLLPIVFIAFMISLLKTLTTNK
jgi:hypothetical protein